MEPLLIALSNQPPVMHLPGSGSNHTRTYLHKNTSRNSDKALILDAFRSFNPEDAVWLVWRNSDLSREQEQHLDELLTLMNFLGRSESWVDACLVRDPVLPALNCLPQETAPEFTVIEEGVDVACPLPPHRYAPEPEEPVSRRKATSIPAEWLDALCWSSQDVIKAKRSSPPAFSWVRYLLFQEDKMESIRKDAGSVPGWQGVRYALDSTVLPRLTESVRVAERVRIKLMGINRRLMGGDLSAVSSYFSGKNQDGSPLEGHRHIYILPEDRDFDGRLDHITVFCRQPLPVQECLSLDRLDRLWQRQGRPDIHCIPILWGTRQELFPPVRQYQSITPFVPNRHHRHGRGSFDQWLHKEVLLELAYHDLPAPERIENMRYCVRQGRQIYWLQFHRTRGEDPIRSGFGFRLSFREPVAGPIAIGYGAHFGLGRFEAVPG